MDKDQLQSYYEQHSVRETAKHFQCSPANIRYWVKKFGICKNQKHLYVETGKKHCPHCGITQSLDQFYKRSNGTSGSWCRKCMSEQILIRQQHCKKLAVAYKGSKCLNCGFSEYLGALEFHHLDLKKKDSRISRMSNRKLTDELKQELDKCVLLCANCHRMAHAGLIQFDEKGNIVRRAGLEPATF